MVSTHVASLAPRESVGVRSAPQIVPARRAANGCAPTADGGSPAWDRRRLIRFRATDATARLRGGCGAVDRCGRAGALRDLCGVNAARPSGHAVARPNDPNLSTPACVPFRFRQFCEATVPRATPFRPRDTPM
jgi:hypothetical protein